MLDVGKQTPTRQATGGARLAAVVAGPFLPVVVYALVASAAAEFRIDLAIVLAAAGLVGAALIHLHVKRVWRCMAEATAAIDARLVPTRPGDGTPGPLPERLEQSARLIGERVDALVARIEKSALADELTGLPNRRAVLPQLKSALATARRSGEPFALALVDLDGMKQVNGTLGDEFGDALLRDFSDVLRSELRASDVAARWSGSDFLLLFPRTPIDAAVHVVDRLRARVADHPLALVDGEPVTLSAGVAGFRLTDLHAEEIVRRADAALELAKRGGRNRVLAVEGEGFRSA
jgi:diguanylate cyclase (GGDEF)-like protein